MRAIVPRLGISACLLGQAVRYDGGHKLDHFLSESLGRFVEWIPVCPEVEVGMSVPRESVRLIGAAAAPRMVAERSGKDWTDAMMRFAAARTRQLMELELSGYVFKKNSPSCGMERVRIYNRKDMPVRRGRGLYAAAVIDRLAPMPVEEEGRLSDPRLRANFVERVFAFRRWQNLQAEQRSPAALMEFHAHHKYLLLAHSQSHYRQLGRMVAEVKRSTLRVTYEAYGGTFMETLKLPTNVKKHANVLEHMLGYFSDQLSTAERRELVELIGDYRRELVPLIVPITLIQHYVKKYRCAYLSGQTYLSPAPKELMLRNYT
jgi:uncharacterized protein YbgA (DUF1722 family)/uncharacterized protein YbbK (DUF523 family)